MCKTVIVFKLFVHICILVYTKNPLKKIKMKDLCLSLILITVTQKDALWKSMYVYLTFTEMHSF